LPGVHCHEEITNSFDAFDTLISCLASIAMKRSETLLILLISSFLSWRHFDAFDTLLSFPSIDMKRLEMLLMLLIRSFLAWRPLP
jgi:hypothetical protein